MLDLLGATGAKACMECGERARAERDRLEAENAQLKAKADAQWNHIKKLQAELGHCIEKSSRDYDRDLDRRRRLATENARLRTTVATAIRVQTVLCGDMDMPRCIAECPLYRPETDDCVACDVIRVAHELGIEVD